MLYFILILAMCIIRLYRYIVYRYYEHILTLTDISIINYKRNLLYMINMTATILSTLFLFVWCISNTITSMMDGIFLILEVILYYINYNDVYKRILRDYDSIENHIRKLKNMK